MIERFLFTVLKRGIEEIQADPEIIDDLFADLHSLAAPEIAAIKTVFATSPPKVVHGYAQSEMVLPVYSIILAEESETDMFIGDDVGMVLDEEDPDFGADIKGSVWQHNYTILCYAEHPDTTRYIYETAKAILIVGTADVFLPEGIHGIRFSGSDLSPNKVYIPEHLFVRQLNFQCRRLFQRVDRQSKLGKAFKVAGIHIDSAGSPSDVGGVKTLVTVGTSGG